MFSKKVHIKTHTRKSKKGNSRVRSHSRVIKKFKDRFDVKTPVTLNKKHKAEGTSLGHTDTIVAKDNKVVRHDIKLDEEKIKRHGESPVKMLKHELGHVLDRELKPLKTPRDSFSKSAEGQKFLKKEIKKDPKLRGKGKYETNPEEQFARAFSKKKI